MAQILCFGASCVYGVGSSGGWADRLKRYMHEEMYAKRSIEAETHEVHNLSIPGETISHLLTRAAPEIEARTRENKDNIVLFEVGGNDSRADGAPDHYVSTPEQLTENLKKLYDAVSPHAAKLLFVGLSPCDEKITAPKINPFTKRESYFTNERKKLMEDTVGAFCKEKGIAFVPLHEAANALGWQEKYLFSDGLHPNEDGAAWIFECVKPQVLELIN